LPPLLNAVFNAAPLVARFCRMSPTEVRPVFCRSARSMTNTGWEVSMSVRLMREPTTVIVSSCSASSCARTGVATASAAVP